MNTATLTRIDYAALDGVILLTARCDQCGTAVHHGGGYDPDNIALGDRVGHCSCSGYDLIDADGVIDAALPALRLAVEARERHAVRRAARIAATR